MRLLTSPSARPKTRETDLWHSQAHMPSVKQAERVIARGEGAYVWDEEGHRLFDAPASLWYANVGHGRRAIADAVAAQMGAIAAYSTFQQFATRPALQLSERLVELSPIPEAKVFLTSGGSDSIDAAVKLALRYWNAIDRPEKRVIVTRERGYHGLHGFGTAISGLPFNRAGYGAALLVATAHVPVDDLVALEQLLYARAGEIAAFIAEPVVCSGGVVPPPPGYLEGARALCRRHDVLFIADEVITGFGRTGAMFASSRFHLEPDLLTFAKGVTSGYLPLGGVLIARRLWEPFWASGSELIFRHGLTYSGHATACAAAMANLDILQDEDLVARALDLETSVSRALAPLEDRDDVTEVRSGVGVLAGVELVSDDLARRVAERCYAAGLLTRVLPTATLHISPPLVCTEAELRRAAEVIDDALDQEGRAA